MVQNKFGVVRFFCKFMTEVHKMERSSRIKNGFDTRILRVNRAGGLNLKDPDIAGEFGHELTHMLQFRTLSDSPIGTGLGGWWTYYILGGVAQLRQLIFKDAYKLPKNIDPFWTPVNILDFEKFPEAVGKSIAKPNVSDYNGIRDVLRRIRELCNKSCTIRLTLGPDRDKAKQLTPSFCDSCK